MTKEWINKTIKEHHAMMCEKGFYDCPECKGEGQVHTAEGEEFAEIAVHGRHQFKGEAWETCTFCGGECKDPNKNIGELLMLIVSELGEALEAHRCGRFPAKHTDMIEWINKQYKEEETRVKLFEINIKDTFEDEIADVFLRLFDLCGYLGIEYKSPDRKIKALKKDLDNKGEVFLFASGMLCEMHLDESTDIDVHFVIDYLSFFSNKWNIPIQKHIEAKMAYNKTRPQKHGKQY